MQFTPFYNCPSLPPPHYSPAVRSLHFSTCDSLTEPVLCEMRGSGIIRRKSDEVFLLAIHKESIVICEKLTIALY